MKRPTTALLFPLIATSFLLGCDPEPEVVSVDPADVVSVDNSAPAPDSRLGWTVADAPALSIGVVEGGGPDQLFRVRDATDLPDGRVAIANSGTGEIRVFGYDGAHVLSMGGGGRGPGEYVTLADVEPWAGDSVIGWDSRQLRMSVFDREGHHGRTFRIRDFEDSFSPEFLGVTGDHRLLVRSGFPQRDDTPYRGMFRADRRYALVDGEGRRSADLGAHPGEEGFLWARGGLETFGEHPHGKYTVSAVWGDLVLISPNDVYELKAFDVAGGLVKVVRLAHEPPPPTRADMEAWFDEFTADDTPAERAAFKRDFDEFPLLDALPAFEEIVVDALEHVWVRDFTRPGDDRTTWVVFDPDGLVLGRIETPPALEVYEVGADYVLGRRRDDLNVEYVERWLLTR